MEYLTPHSTFHPFSRLPPELRQQIWRLVLPCIEDIKPALFFYKRGLWKDDPMGSQRQDYWEYNTYINLVFEHQLLSPVQININLAAVNYEANSVTAKWAENEGLKVYQSRKSGFIIAERFNPQMDCLYVDHKSLLNFMCGCEAQRRAYDPDSPANTETFGWSQVNYLALPLKTLKEKGVEGLRWFLLTKTSYPKQDYFDHLEELWLVKDSQPKELLVKANDESIHRRWTIKDAGQDKEMLHKIKTELNTWFVNEATRNVKIRTVRAVLA